MIENKPLSHGMRHLSFVRERSVSLRSSPLARRVPWVLGAAMFVRLAAMNEVGGLDESFFMYYEEIDLSRRLLQGAWETHHVPAAAVMHVGAASTSQIPTTMRIQRFRSSISYYQRHCAGLNRWFWTTLVRAKAIAPLLGAALRLLSTRDPAKRGRPLALYRAWRAIVLGPAAAAPPPAMNVTAAPIGNRAPDLNRDVVE